MFFISYIVNKNGSLHPKQIIAGIELRSIYFENRMLHQVPIYIYKSWNQNRSYIVISYIYGTATYYIQIDYVFSKALGLRPWISTANIRGQLLCCVGWTWHLDLDYSTIRFSSRKMGLFSTGFLSRPATHLYLSSELKLQALPAWNYSFILIIEFGTKNGDAHPSFKIHI